MPDRVDETLTEIETGAWLTATAQPNRQQAVDRRSFAASQIRQKLLGISRPALNEALSLKQSFNNDPTQQRLRRGIRAILLSEFTLKRTPLSQAPILKQRWIGQNEDAIRRGFLATLPNLLDDTDPNRLLWSPANFTDPATFPDWLGQPTNTLNYRFIVTCLPTDDRVDAILAAPDATLQGWAAISTSIIDQTNSMMYGYYGFVLRVPENNILVTSSQDLDMHNHVGTPKSRTVGHETGLDPLTRSGLLSQHLSDLFAKQGRLKTPQECIGLNRNAQWNEIAVMGRHPRWGTVIEVTALFFRVGLNHRYYVVTGTTKSPINDAIERKVAAAAKVFQLPVIYIPDGTGTTRR